MSTISTTTPMIVKTNRGPCIAGRRTTIYVIMDHLKSGLDRELIKELLLLSDEQLDAAIEYIAQHGAEVERDYAEIVRRSEERRAHSEKVFRARSKYPPEMPIEEKAALMRQDLINRKQQAASAGDDDQNPA